MPYGSLRSFSFACDTSAPALMALLETLGNNPRLTKLSLGDSASYMKLPLRKLWEKIGMQSSLETLYLFLEDDEMMEEYSLGAAALTAIRHCSAPQTLSLHTTGRVRMSDMEIESLVKHFPRLRSFDLLDFGLQTTPLNTLKAIAIIAAVCSDIRSIGLCVDATAVPPLELNHLQTPASLRSLKVLSSPIKDAHAVALFIDELFPETKVSAGGWGSLSAGVGLWREVSAWLPTLRKARLYERKRLTATPA